MEETVKLTLKLGAKDKEKLAILMQKWQEFITENYEDLAEDSCVIWE